MNRGYVAKKFHVEGKILIMMMEGFDDPVSGTVENST